MLKLRLLVLIITFFFFQPSYAHPNKVKLEQQLQHDAAMLLANDQFVSLSVGVVTGNNSYTKHFGELTIDKGNQPNDETLYEIGSVSKTMVGLLTPYAVHDNKLALEENINRYILDDLNNVDLTLRDQSPNDLIDGFVRQCLRSILHKHQKKSSGTESSGS